MGYSTSWADWFPLMAKGLATDVAVPMVGDEHAPTRRLPGAFQLILRQGGCGLPLVVRPWASALPKEGHPGTANAAGTAFRATPNRRTIPLIDTPSDMCNRLISAQSSTLITPSL